MSAESQPGIGGSRPPVAVGVAPLPRATGLVRTFNLLDKILELVATVSFATVFFSIAVAVMLRYVFSFPIVWSEELAGMAAAWMVFSGAAVAVFRAEHITVDIFMRLPVYAGWVRRAHEVVVVLAIIIFGLSLATAGATIASASWSRTLPALGWPYGSLYLASSVGGAAMALFGVYRLFYPRRIEVLPEAGD